MSNLARAWAEKQAPGAGCQMHLLEVIAAFHNDDLGFCTASNRYLAARLRKSEATIERGLKGLEACGLIHRDTTRWGPDGGARRRISLKNYCPVAMQAELDARKALAKARRAAKQAAKDTAASPLRSPHSEGQVPSFCGSGTLSLGGSESLEESLDNYSELGGSAPQGGAEPGRDFRKDLFDRGARTVQRLTGRSMAKSRALIGSWLRIVDDEAATVLAAIDMAEEGELAEPTGWIGTQLHAAARRAGFGPQRRRNRDGALGLLCDAMGMPNEGEPGYDEWYRNYLHKTFGTPLPEDAQPSRQPVDVTPRGQDRTPRGQQRVANGAIGLFLKRMDGRLVGEPPAAPKETPTAVLDAHNAKAMEMAKRGQWPVGGRVFVERDAAEGRAWEEYFARFGTRPCWMTLSKGVGAYMPAPWPPAVVAEA